MQAVSQRFLSVGLHTVSKSVCSVRPPESVFFALKLCHVRQNPVSTFACNIVHLSGLTATRMRGGVASDVLPGDIPPSEPASLRHTIIPLNNKLHPHFYFTFALNLIPSTSTPFARHHHISYLLQCVSTPNFTCLAPASDSNRH